MKHKNPSFWCFSTYSSVMIRINNEKENQLRIDLEGRKKGRKDGIATVAMELVEA